MAAIGSGTVNTTWTYGTGTRSARRSATHWARAKLWHSAQHDWDVRHAAHPWRRQGLRCDRVRGRSTGAQGDAPSRWRAACTSGGAGGAGVNLGVHFAAQSIAQFLNDPRLVPNPGAGQVRELLDFLTWISSFEGFTLRPTIASYS